MTADLTLDHKPLEGAQNTRRYFAKFERIIGHLQQVAKMTTQEGLTTREESRIIRAYLGALSHTFSALSYKYLLTWRVSGALPNGMAVDRQESGFPVYAELLQMANDAINADRHLRSLPDVTEIKQDMVRHILNEHAHPTRLQFTLSQRMYYQALSEQSMFWAQNDPQAIWQGSDDGRRRYLLHWAVFDSQQNLPVIYIMEVEDTGRTALVKDERRWPQVQSHLMAQAVSTLKLLTIAKGFDQDFDELHPKQLRRITLGPMYSHAYTQQSGPLREVLAEAQGQQGLDWALAWTTEVLRSAKVTQEKTGWFSSAERQVYQGADGTLSDDAGYSEMRRSLILPARPYQILEHRDPPGFRGVRKYVVGNKDQVLIYD